MADELLYAPPQILLALMSTLAGGRGLVLITLDRLNELLLREEPVLLSPPLIHKGSGIPGAVLHTHP